MTFVIQQLTGAQEADALRVTQERESNRRRSEGDEAYIVSNRWFSSWCKYSGYLTYVAGGGVVSDETGDEAKAAATDVEARPGPIDNSDILDTDSSHRGSLTIEEFESVGVMKEGLKEQKDFWVFHKSAWLLLKEWYGVRGGSEIRRTYLLSSIDIPELDAYQWHVKAEVEGTGQSVIVPCLGMSEGTALKQSACKMLDIRATGSYELCIIDVTTGQNQSIEDKLFKTLIGLKIRNFSLVRLRIAAKDEPVVTAQENQMPVVSSNPIPLGVRIPVDNVIKYNNSPPPLNIPSSPGFGAIGSPTRGVLSSPISSSPLSRSFGRVPLWAEDTVHEAAGQRKGLAGFSNLGNTCFMNSSLQCLCHTPSLMYSFLSGAYREDLNADNPLGLGGKLASAFAGLMSKLWQGNVLYVTPKHFKWQLGKFAPQFGGYSQQDSQELLAFLLDGLHEDLNRIKTKPYKEEKDADGRPDEDVAAEAWENYRARNDSVIVDKFQGLYKSTLQCPRCHYISIKFDPFMYLSLPLPSPKRRTFVLTTVDQFNSIAPMEIGVRIAKRASIRELLKEVSKVFSEHYQVASNESEWALAQWNGTKLEVFSNTEVNVDSIPEKRMSFFSSSRSLKLYAFRYCGGQNVIPPGPDTRPVHIFHKFQSGTWPIPSLYFLPKEAMQSSLAVKAAEKSGYWEVELDDSLKSALTSFENNCIRPHADKKADSAMAEADGTNDAQSMSCSSPLETSNAPGEETPSTAAPLLEGDTIMQAEPNSINGEQGMSKVLFGSYNGNPKYTWTSTPPQFGPQDEPIYLTVEWSIEINKEHEAMYENVFEHESVKISNDEANVPYKASLKDCVDAFCQAEQLDESDTWYCKKCKDHVRAVKKLDLWHLPDVLVVHLKRFSYSRYSRDKLDTNIQFPLQGLDLSDYIPSPCSSSKKLKLSDDESSDVPSKDPIYDLYAVSNHFGGLGGGHYTAFCKMPDDQAWYDFDDSHISPTQPSNIQSPAAYLLFYSRRGSDVGLAQKSLELAQRISHDEIPKACDSPIKSLGNNTSLARPSLDIVDEVPWDEDAESPKEKMTSSTQTAHALQRLSTDDADIMSIDAV